MDITGMTAQQTVRNVEEKINHKSTENTIQICLNFLWELSF
jgi:DNA-binding CsgD family transcriptional regulator